MKRSYSSPEFEYVELSITKDVLNVSDPMETTPIGEGGGQGSASSDPFGEILP